MMEDLLGNMSLTGTSDSCGEWDGVVTWCAIALLTIAISIVIFFSFLTKRRQFKRDCCCGTPGLFPPLDFLTGHPSRLVLTLTLAALSGHVLRNSLYQPVFFNIDATTSQILSVFIRMFWILYATVVFLPSVTCSATPLPVLGYSVGALYTTTLIGWYIVWVYTFQRGCLYFAIQLNIEPPELSTTVVGITPIVLCLIGVLIWYIVHLVMVLKDCSKKGWFEPDYTLHFNSYKYVRTLFDTKKDPVIAKNKLQLIINKIYTNKPGFGYPLRVTVALGGAAIVLYELTFLIIPPFLTLSNNLLINLNTIANNSCSDSTDSEGENNSTTLLCGVINHRKVIIDGLTAFLISGPLLAFPLSILQFIPILKSIRSHLLRGYKGDKTFFSQKLSSHFILASTMKYPGFQIGYLVWGWVLYVLTIWLIGLLLLLTIFAFIYRYSTVIFIVSGVILTIIINISVHIVQAVFAKFLLIEGNPKTPQDIIITNRRLYHIVSYLLYSYNGLLGVGSALIRSFMVTVQGLVYAPRLDTSGTRNSKLDKGHLTYLAFIQLELIQSNPIAHVFIDMLTHCVQEKKRNRQVVEEGLPTVQDRLSQVEVESFEDSTQRQERASTLSTINSHQIYNVLGAQWPHLSLRAYNRWHLACLLLRNPSIAAYRCHRGNKDNLN